MPHSPCEWESLSFSLRLLFALALSSESWGGNECEGNHQKGIGIENDYHYYYHYHYYIDWLLEYMIKW